MRAGVDGGFDRGGQGGAGQAAGLAKAAGQVLSSDGGVFTTQVATPAGPVAISVVRTAKGDWLAVVQPPAGAKVCPPLVREALGDGKLTPLALIVRNARLSKAAEGQPQILRLVQAGRDPLFVDETLRINLLKPGEMDLAPLARTLRRAIIEADRLAKQAATEKAAADRQRKKPKRAKR